MKYRIVEFPSQTWLAGYKIASTDEQPVKLEPARESDSTNDAEAERIAAEVEDLPGAHGVFPSATQEYRRELAEQLREAIKLGVTVEEAQEGDASASPGAGGHPEENCVDSECEAHGTHEPLPVEVGVDESVPELVFSGGEVPCCFLTGKSGSGKTTYLRNRMESEPGWGLMCSSTGISAINLNTITINSLLGYFDTDSMEDAWVTGRINRKLREVAKSAEVLCIDEISMVPDKQLTILYRAIAEFNESVDRPKNEFDDDDDAVMTNGRSKQLKLLLCGDFAQLAPVKANWAFESEVWVPNFSEHTVKLTKIWRQTEPHFVEAMNALREGNGRQALELLVDKCGVVFHDEIDTQFEGTTIVAKNEQVDRINTLMQMNVKGALVQVQTKRVGLQRGEWQKNIPSYQQYKIGSYVMLLANQYTEGAYGQKDLIYANGDCAYIREWDAESRVAVVELVRNSKLVTVGMLTRENTQRVQPKGDELDKLKRNKNWISGERVPGVRWEPWKQDRGGRWVVGEIEYMPMRLGYASTTFKSQGLSLDRGQIEIKAPFMGSYNQLYVAFSRVRSAAGLRVVGTHDLLVKRCQTDPKCAAFL